MRAHKNNKNNYMSRTNKITTIYEREEKINGFFR